MEDIYIDKENQAAAVEVLRSIADRIESGEITITSGGFLLETFPATESIGLSANLRFGKVK